MNQLQTIEFKNVRVLTTQQIAEAYKADTKYISNNFNSNKDRYVEGKHYYCLKGQDLKEFKANHEIHDLPNNVNTLYLWTERGAFLHAKSLNTDTAWEIYDELIESYFKSTSAKPNQLPTSYKEALQALIVQVEENERLQLENTAVKQINGELKPKADYYDEILKNKGLVTTTAIAKDYGMSANMFNRHLHEMGIQFKQSNQWFLYQKYADKGYTHSETVNITRGDGRADIAMHTKWTQKGRVFLYEALKQQDIVPIIEQI